ncbi:MAG: hypothetical protein AB2826_25725 [Candidatus Thiodiazotropha sp.]
MRILRTTLIFIAVIVIHGCTKPYKPPIIEPADSAFLGFHPSSIDVNETNLVMIHGMCHQDNEWVEKSSSRLADHFGMVKQETELLFKDNSSNVQVFKTIIGNDNYSINLYGIVYGPSTLPFKRFLCKDVSKESDICPTISYTRVRASLNSKLKDNLLNNCLADAIIYLGDLGNIIRKGVKNSLLSIITDIENSNSPVYILSESLGSKIIRDGFYPVSTDG